MPDNNTTNTNDAYDITPSEAVVVPPMRVQEYRARRRQELLRQRIDESKAGVRTLLILAQYLIQMSVRTEPNPAVRGGKRKSLGKTWREFEIRLLGTIES